MFEMGWRRGVEIVGREGVLGFAVIRVWGGVSMFGGVHVGILALR